MKVDPLTSNSSKRNGLNPQSVGSARLKPPSIGKGLSRPQYSFLKISTARPNRLASFKPGDCKSGRSPLRAKKQKS